MSTVIQGNPRLSTGFAVGFAVKGELEKCSVWAVSESLQTKKKSRNLAVSALSIFAYNSSGSHSILGTFRAGRMQQVEQMVNRKQLRKRGQVLFPEAKVEEAISSLTCTIGTPIGTHSGHSLMTAGRFISYTSIRALSAETKSASRLLEDEQHATARLFKGSSIHLS